MKALLTLATMAAMAIGATQAAATTVNTNNWTATTAPANDATISSHAWVTGGNQASISNNAHTTLVSDFSTSGDFTYSGNMRATSDNDIQGVVFGWQNKDNHYRLGWEGGGYGDQGTSIQRGLWLIRESGGVDTVLFNISSLLWSAGTNYDFSITRTGGNLSFSMMLGGATLAAATVTDTTFMTGKVGVYVESNYSQFSNLNVTEPAGVVPLPASLPFLMAGLGGLGLMARRRKA